MSYNGIAPLWDLNLPPALPEISDDQFLALLNQQFESTSPQDALKQQQPTANPQALTRFPTVNLSPLVSEESSPSPPGSSTDPAATRSRRVSEHHRVTRSSDLSRNDDQHKRKASFDEDEDDDDDDGQPQHKSFHGDQAPSRKPSARRKSAPGATQKDESRLLKRKEQNRAAQRAFRERKEKHVRDLEEKVASLEAKSEMQAVENSNLRDMLTRLQTENRSLKDSSFTFAVPGTAASPDLGLAGKSAGLNLPQSPQSLSGSTTMNPTPDMNQSPALFEQNMAYFSPQFFNLESLPSSPPPPDLSIYGGMPQIVAPTQGPYITLASNPFTMSFAEPMPLSSFLADSQSTSHSPPPTLASPSQTQDGAMSPRTLNELFGGFDSLGSFGSNFDVFGANSGTPSSSTVSPVAHKTSVPSGTSSQTADVQPMDVQTTCGGPSCPKSKEDMAAKISASPIGTFGPPVTTPSPFASMSTPSVESETLHTDSPFSAVTKATSDSGCGDDIPGISVGMTEPSPNNLPLNEAWEHVQKHPRFSECDMDELCVMLSAKAKCDGTQKVVEPESVKHVLSKIPDLAQQAQFRK